MLPADALALSDDEGVSWKHTRRLAQAAPGAGESFSYPSLIQGRDGRIHVTYSCSAPGGNSIAHAAVDLDWIRAGSR